MTRAKRKILNCDKLKQKELREKYPFLYELECGENSGNLHDIAISIFDHWLSEDEAVNLLGDVSAGGEVESRVAPHRNFNHFLVSSYESFTYRFKGKLNHRYVVFKKFKTLGAAKDYVEPKIESVSNRYKFSLIIPELDAIYFEGDDYTNYLYSSNPNNLSLLLSKAQELGLYGLS
ncbi:hypothetical protein [Marinibactrum halimedae]|uniref:Uncharacterized protein n=1 Tax=Marinibactrum halimedae TaxID=1444977 RepID=A0AA37WN20_9GAMM|nr:hypothetical protein [Marinibactrum halimedae]MCD9461357.1 hypothetical protein [Marinibactrum halimedae]GLS24622.1 hypothetical protein GCM10007877_03360 [Marinibactrum halimedae]